MKRILAILLSAVLLIGCLPLTAVGAKELSVEEKFRLLLDDYDFEPDCEGNLPLRWRDYYYELAQYPQTDPDWVLFKGGATYDAWDSDTESMCATLGNKLVYVDKVGAPFKLNYGVYDTKSGLFYDLLDAWNMDFENLRDTWNALPPTDYGSGGVYASPRFLTFLIGDADRDGEVTILDATHIQRDLAGLGIIEAQGTFDLAKRLFLRGTKIRCSADYDRDGDFTIMDATKIQRRIADLPNVFEYRVVVDKMASDEKTHNRGQDVRLLSNRTDLEAFFSDYSDPYYADQESTGTTFDNVTRRDIEPFDDAYFQDKALIGVYIWFPDLGYSLQVRGVSLAADGVLSVDGLVCEKLPAGEMPYPRFILIEISKAFIDDVRSVKLNTTLDPPDPNQGQYYADVVKKSEAIVRPAQPEDEGYTMIDYTPSYHGCFDFGASNRMLEKFGVRAHDGKGLFAYVTSSSILSEFLPGIVDVSEPEEDPEERYNSKFFEKNALVVFLTYESYGVQCGLSHLAVKDGTLYGEYHTAEYIIGDWDQIYYAVYEVKRYAVRNTALWFCTDCSSPYMATGAALDKISAAPDYDDFGYRSANSEPVIVSAPENLTKSNFPLMGYGNHPLVTCVINNRVQFDFLLRGFDAERTLTDADFDRYSYVAVIAEGANVEIADVYYDGMNKDGYDSIGVELLLSHTDSDTRISYAIRRIYKTTLSGVSNIELWQIDERLESFSAAFPRYDAINTYIPDDPVRAGWKLPDVTTIPVTCTKDGLSFSWSMIGLKYPDDEGGYVMLIQDRAEFERMLPFFDTEKVYDDAFFAEYSIVAVFGQGGDHTAYASLSNVAVKDGVLALTPQVGYNYPLDPDGNPILQPTAPICWTFAKVKKSDIGNIKSIQSWKLWTAPVNG